MLENAGGKGPILAPANSHGVNTLAVADFKIIIMLSTGLRLTKKLAISSWSWLSSFQHLWVSLDTHLSTPWSRLEQSGCTWTPSGCAYGRSGLVSMREKGPSCGHPLKPRRVS